MNKNSEELDRLLDKTVEIEFTDGGKEKGILKKATYSKYPYWLITPGYDVAFCKSHVKKIKEKA